MRKSIPRLAALLATRKPFFFCGLILCMIVAAGCGDNASERSLSEQRPSPPPPRQASTAQAPAPSASPATTGRPKIVAFGDSLTAGYGLAEQESYPSLLQRKLDESGYQYEVVNAGVSGDTSAGGLRRIDWALEGSEVRVLILELGANDILRGQPINLMKRNLDEIIRRAKTRGIRVLLAGMYAPTSSGPDYQKEVHEAYTSLAREHDVPLIPFFLDQVAGIESLNLADGAHPNAAGTRIVTETVYRALLPLLEKERAGGAPEPSSNPDSRL